MYLNNAINKVGLIDTSKRLYFEIYLHVLNFVENVLFLEIPWN